MSWAVGGLAVFAILLVTAAVFDLRAYRIPNWLTGATALAAFIFALPMSLAAWEARGASVLIVGLVVLLLYMRGGLGGGDVKMLAACSLWIPVTTLPVFVLALAMAGGVQALLTVSFRRLAPAHRETARTARMPYAVSIAVAGLVWTAVRLRSA